MTTETSTTISSISGTNIQTISSTAAKPQNVQKRTVHQFETDKIEVQSSETPTAPTALNKVSKSSFCVGKCPRLPVTRFGFV